MKSISSDASIINDDVPVFYSRSATISEECVIDFTQFHMEICEFAQIGSGHVCGIWWCEWVEL